MDLDVNIKKPTLDRILLRHFAPARLKNMSIYQKFLTSIRFQKKTQDYDNPLAIKLLPRESSTDFLIPYV